MRRMQKIEVALMCVFLAVGAAAAAEPGQGHGPGQMRPPVAHPAPVGEPHRGPSGYQRVEPPKGWDARPAKVDRPTYQHNFKAARSYHIGPYHRPRGWVAHTWAYGQILPRAYWSSQYILADYWLFSLEVPPAGCEWVRDGSDALLISLDTGEILQVEYGVFA